MKPVRTGIPSYDWNRFNGQVKGSLGSMLNSSHHWSP
jgi:hypothetical protein